MIEAIPLDKSTREKYDEELSEVEDELEKMYNDPMAVWRELLKSNGAEDENGVPEGLPK